MDLLACDTTNKAVATFLYLLLQHLELVQKDNSTRKEDEYAPTYYDFEESGNHGNIKIYKPKPGTKLLPQQLDGINCGLYAMLICESYMRGIILSIKKRSFGKYS